MGSASWERVPGGRGSDDAERRASAFFELRIDPVHHLAQLATLDLDLVSLLLRAHALEVLLAGAVLGDPLARERPVLDLAEHGLHGLTRLVGDDPLAARQVAVLG